MPVTLFSPQQDVDVLDVAGDINALDMVRVKNRLDRLIRKNHTRIILHFKNIKHIDFIGLGILIERLRQMRALDGDLKLVGLNGYVLKLFKKTGVNKLIDIYDDTVDALRSFDNT
ncbi:MAG: STAS domain-containing protein [Candidatus Omnitrophota bacterium]|nr:STAS domain-containing protein [Candidatus Omnitrophota bacterium]